MKQHQRRRDSRPRRQPLGESESEESPFRTEDALRGVMRTRPAATTTSRLFFSATPTPLLSLEPFLVGARASPGLESGGESWGTR